MTLSKADSAEIDILMKEYPTLREEILFHFKEAKLPAKFLQIFVAGSIVIVYSLMFGITDDQITKATLPVTRVGMLICLLPIINFISFYFAFDIVDSYYCIFLAATRLRSIEERVNKLHRRPILVTETFQASREIIFGISRTCISLVQTSTVILLSLVVPLFAYSYLWPRAELSWQKVIICLGYFLCIGMSTLFLYTCYRVFLKERNRIYVVLTTTIADLGKNTAPSKRDRRAPVRQDRSPTTG